MIMPQPYRGDARYRNTDPAALQALIGDELTRQPLSQAFPVTDHRRRPEHCQTGVARITMVFSGQRRVDWAEGGRIVQHHLGPGDAIVVSPASWTRPRGPHAPHRYCSIDAYPGFTRYMCEASRDADNRPGAGVVYTDGPLPPPARALLQAVLAIADTGDRARLQPALACYLAEAIRGCARRHDELPGQAVWQQAAAWVHDHLDPSIGRDAIADAVAVHPNHLSRLCRRFTGASLSDFLTDVRIDRAKRLLTDPDVPIAAVTAGAGYRDATHFRKRFTQVVGRSPAAWRRAHLANESA